MVYGLFPHRFGEIVDRAIQEEAARKIHQGRVSRASLAFSEKTAPGFVLQNVTVEAVP
jgi:hypothetical protein